jgi:uncharacterized protein
MSSEENVSEDPVIGNETRSSNSASIKRIRARQWGLAIHFSLLAGYVVPVAGWLMPLTIWQVKKHELPTLDLHGKHAMNAVLSYFLFGTIGLTLYLIALGALPLGLPTLVAHVAFMALLAPLAIASCVFPIVAGIKANHGEYWKYPMAINLIPTRRGGKRSSKSSKSGQAKSDRGARRGARSKAFQKSEATTVSV